MDEKESEIKFEDGQIIELGDDVMSITAKPVIIKKVEKRPVVSKEGVGYGDKLVFYAKHPDREEVIELSKVKYESDKKLKIATLWFKPTSEGKIAKNTALGSMIKHFAVKPSKYTDILVGQSVNTDVDEAGYLVIKAY